MPRGTSLQRTATRSNALQHTATHQDNMHTLKDLKQCRGVGHHNTLQHTATHCNTHCNTLQHTRRHRNKLKDIATDYTTLQHTTTHHTNEHTIKASTQRRGVITETRYNTLQHAAIHCNTLQHTATHYNTLQHTASHQDNGRMLKAPTQRQGVVERKCLQHQP